MARLMDMNTRNALVRLNNCVCLLRCYICFTSEIYSLCNIVLLVPRTGFLLCAAFLILGCWPKCLHFTFYCIFPCVQLFFLYHMFKFELNSSVAVMNCDCWLLPCRPRTFNVAESFAGRNWKRKEKFNYAESELFITIAGSSSGEK